MKLSQQPMKRGSIHGMLTIPRHLSRISVAAHITKCKRGKYILACYFVVVVIVAVVVLFSVCLLLR